MGDLVSLPFGNEREYNVSISYFEDGVVKGMETPAWAPSFAAAILQAEKILKSRHPKAIPFRVVSSDVVQSSATKPIMLSGGGN